VHTRVLPNMPRLRYTDRQLLAETGTLGDLADDTVSPELAEAMVSLIGSARPLQVRRPFLEALSAACSQHFVGGGVAWYEHIEGGGPAGPFLDFTEIAAEEARSLITCTTLSAAFTLNALYLGSTRPSGGSSFVTDSGTR